MLISPSKRLFAIWIITQTIAWVSIIVLILTNPIYLILGLMFLMVTVFNFNAFIHKNFINPIVKLKQIYPTLWQIEFKNNKIQKIQLSRYYRSSYFIILIYKPIDSKLSRLSTLVLSSDALSKAHYQQLAALLWPG